MTGISLEMSERVGEASAVFAAFDASVGLTGKIGAALPETAGALLGDTVVSSSGLRRLNKWTPLIV